VVPLLLVSLLLVVVKEGMPVRETCQPGGGCSSSSSLSDVPYSWKSDLLWLELV